MEVLAQMINLALPKLNGPKACRIWGYTKMVYFSNITKNISVPALQMLNI
jgi:hypothetical protein